MDAHVTHAAVDCKPVVRNGIDWMGTVSAIEWMFAALGEIARARDPRSPVHT